MVMRMEELQEHQRPKHGRNTHLRPDSPTKMATHRTIAPHHTTQNSQIPTVHRSNVESSTDEPAECVKFSVPTLNDWVQTILFAKSNVSNIFVESIWFGSPPIEQHIRTQQVFGDAFWKTSRELWILYCSTEPMFVHQMV